MDADEVEKIAAAVLYEGYLLFPYRRSAVKNQQRWTFGGVYPRRFGEDGGGHDPWLMQTQCLVVGHAGTRLAVKVRFLHVVDRLVGQYSTSHGASSGPLETARTSGVPYPSEPLSPGPAGAQGAPPTAGDPGVPHDLIPVASLRVGAQVYRPWEEAAEREVTLDSLTLGDLVARSRTLPIRVRAGSSVEPLVEPGGAVAGAIVRTWRSLQGMVEISAAALQEGRDALPAGETCYRLTVRITNTTPWSPGHNGPTGQTGTTRPAESVRRERNVALRQTLVSTHTILRVQDGAFVSLLEPPAELQPDAAACTNIKTWPVLVGDEGDRATVLSSPIILYDYPRVSPESPGDLFDATEIDELLRLSIMALTDEEKQEMRESDGRGREILERTESLAHDHLMKLHAAVRSLEPSEEER